MSQRLKIQEMVKRMHEENIVMRNILRDIVENEILYDRAMDGDDNFLRKFSDCSVRRTEILSEIRHFLDSEHLPQRMHA